MKSVRSYIIFGICAVAFVAGWMWLVNTIWPPPPPKESVVVAKARESAEAGILAGTPLPNQETVAIVLGAMAVPVEPVSQLEPFPKPAQEAAILVAGSLAAGTNVVRPLKREGQPRLPEAPKIEPAKPEDNKPYGELIAIGQGEKPYYLRALLNTRGGAVQQIVLTEFNESDREGLLVTTNGKSDGPPVKLHLVPGFRVERKDDEKICGMPKIPVLPEGKYSREFFAQTLSQPSFLMFHYEKPGDERPLVALGDRDWKYVEAESERDPNADEQKIVFRTDLDEPFFLRITKTFTLKPREYHLGLKVDIKRLDGKEGPNQFRYQLTGANGLPIEGEWYTSTYRQAIVGFGDEKGHTTRYVEDAASVRLTEGSDRQTRTDKLAIRYAAVAVQYFASALAVDDEQQRRNFVEFVRATPVHEHPPLRSKNESRNPKDWVYFDALDDLTVRAISETFDPSDVAHKYLLYHGPVKVRLLREMPAGQEVAGALVDRYIDKISLDTLTDAPLPNALGRFANAIYWTNIVIWFTNQIHLLLWALHQFIPSLAICIVVLTVIVRAILFPFSRRQAHNGQVMQAKMAKLQPELRKLQEKFGADFQRMNQERIKLYKEHHVNPFAAMGGCLLLMVQMPIMMGLYYALQESVFFRLATFLWIPNLAAPDMLVFWGEQIPVISKPSDLGSSLYLGPYFNVLPVVAVSLMLYQQVKMMPKSDDPQVQSQQKMMKFMMIMMGFFFYKVASGLCLYFITSTAWAILERRFLPKPVKPEEVADEPNVGAAQLAAKKAEELPPKPLGWWGRKKRNWKTKWDEILEQAQKQQEFRRDPSPQQSPDRDKGKKKKKKR